MPLYLLSEKLAFPSPDQADAEGLLAVGGDLSPQRLVLAYSTGIFPWYSEGEPILWWSPDPRMVIRPEEYHPSKSLQKEARKKTYRISMDEAFEQVLDECALVPRHDQEGTWITQGMKQGYTELFQHGVAHSIECWLDDQLVGGLYGLSLGKVFFGESMFSKRSNTSKLCFWALNDFAQNYGLEFIDCQLHNPHLESLGAYTIPKKEYLQWLYPALQHDTHLGSWTEDFAQHKKNNS
jgi:leucyl/phenylalanyl-tRNA---protein transferase